MGLLLYKSNEMFSSTELIRKSKTIFNKIIDNEIDKAIIMRDGKPGFLLMDFKKYEEIMGEFENLKVQISEKNSKNSSPKKVLEVKTPKIEEISVENIPKKEKVKIQPSQVVPPRPTKEEIIIEPKEEDEVIVENSIKVEQKTKEDIEEEISEEEEISKAMESIQSMNFDDTMKKVAEQKIKAKILEARRIRAKQKEQEDIDNRVDLKEELEIQVHIKEENMKKERELKEFWD